MSLNYIVGYDEDPPSRAALDVTRGLARRTGAHVIAAHVYPSLAGLYASPFGTPEPFAYAAVEGSAQAAAERMLEDIAGDVEARTYASARSRRSPWPTTGTPSPGARCRSRRSSARARRTRRRGHLRRGVDLLVTGSRGYGPVRSVMLGAASRHIVDHAPCPVLVLPRGARMAVLTEPLSAAATAAALVPTTTGLQRTM